MHEDTFRNKLQKKLEEIGGIVLRIRDVYGTGMRYSDLIWIIDGRVIGIECKIAKFHSEHTYLVKQGTYATRHQLLANHLFQRAGALFVYAFHFPDEKCTLFAQYRDEAHVYSAKEAKEKLPWVVLSEEEFFTFVRVLLNSRTNNKNVLTMFKEFVLDYRMALSEVDEALRTD